MLCKSSTRPLQLPLPEVLSLQDLPHMRSDHCSLVGWAQSATSAASTQSTSGLAPVAPCRVTSSACSRSSSPASHSAASVRPWHKRRTSATAVPHGRGGSSVSAARCTRGVVASSRRSASWKPLASQQAAPPLPPPPAPQQLYVAPSPVSRQLQLQELMRQHHERFPHSQKYYIGHSIFLVLSGNNWAMVFLHAWKNSQLKPLIHLDFIFRYRVGWVVWVLCRTQRLALNPELATCNPRNSSRARVT